METRRAVSNITPEDFSFLYQENVLASAISKKVFAISVEVRRVNSTNSEEISKNEKAGRYDEREKMR
jgi:hypothetical protein